MINPEQTTATIRKNKFSLLGVNESQARNALKMNPFLSKKKARKCEKIQNTIMKYTQPFRKYLRQTYQ